MRRSFYALIVFLFFGCADETNCPDCYPVCRSGYVCSCGECVSLCNPPCGDEERCNPDTRECEPITDAAEDPDGVVDVPLEPSSDPIIEDPLVEDIIEELPADLERDLIDVSDPVDEEPAPFDPSIHYNGVFDITPCLSQTCTDIAYTACQLSFNIAGPELRVIVGPYTLVQNPAPTTASFGPYTTHMCFDPVRLTGTFSDADHFSARWEETGTGSCPTCPSKDATIAGVRH